MLPTRSFRNALASLGIFFILLPPEAGAQTLVDVDPAINGRARGRMRYNYNRNPMAAEKVIYVTKGELKAILDQIPNDSDPIALYVGSMDMPDRTTWERLNGSGGGNPPWKDVPTVIFKYESAGLIAGSSNMNSPVFFHPLGLVLPGHLFRIQTKTKYAAAGKLCPPPQICSPN